jgi:hypothetical protein
VGKDGVVSRLRDYMYTITQYAQAFGCYTRKGLGPEFTLDANGNRVLHGRGLLLPNLWPYPKLDPHKLHEGGVYV